MVFQSKPWRWTELFKNVHIFYTLGCWLASDLKWVGKKYWNKCMFSCILFSIKINRILTILKNLLNIFVKYMIFHNSLCMCWPTLGKVNACQETGYLLNLDGITKLLTELGINMAFVLPYISYFESIINHFIELWTNEKSLVFYQIWGPLLLTLASL